MANPVDYSDVQGLLRFGYNSLTEATFLLLRIRDAAAASAWIAAAPITNAIELDQAPATALQIAITRQGLEALRVPANVIAGLADEFISGMCGEENRSRRLGDIGANAPEYWRWGVGEKIPQVLAMLYAPKGQLASFAETIKGPSWQVAFDVLDALPTSDLQGVEPFGFTDGISQPTLDWRQLRTAATQAVYTNDSCLGEFLLGYQNEYGRYTDRPLLPATASNAGLLDAPDAPGMRDLGRNGTYLVFRQLQQDVRGFWQFVNGQAKGDTPARERLAGAMVGRTRQGDPLEMASGAIAGVGKSMPSNQFNYDSDADGRRCPFGAHIRRANPRNADFPAGTSGLFSELLHNLGFTKAGFREDIMSSTRFHRLLRRGREYGPGLSTEQALQPDYPDSQEHGINFICLNANISRQFEFVQGAWLMNTKFNGMNGESDPLLGNRQPIPGCPVTSSFLIPQEHGVARRVESLPRFVTVRGGAYFFLPGLRALKFLCSYAKPSADEDKIRAVN
jgi:Dyp-type peroxidase family